MIKQSTNKEYQSEKNRMAKKLIWRSIALQSKIKNGKETGKHFLKHTEL